MIMFLLHATLISLHSQASFDCGLCPDISADSRKWKKICKRIACCLVASVIILVLAGIALAVSLRQGGMFIL